MMPPEMVGEQMEPEKLSDAVNVILSLQVSNYLKIFFDKSIIWILLVWNKPKRIFMYADVKLDYLDAT